MPFRRSTKTIYRNIRRRARSRVYRRRRAKYAPRRVRFMKYKTMRGSMPTAKLLKFRYVLPNTEIPLGPATAVDIVLRGNSLFDPEQALGGHQPYGFDQYATWYSRYAVVASKCALYGTSNGNNTEVMIAARRDSAPILGTSSTELERPMTVSKLCPSGTTKFVSMYRTTKAVLGSRPKTSGDDDLTALMTQNPFREWYWHVVIANNGLDLGVDMSRKIVVTYYAILFDRIFLPGS